MCTVYIYGQKCACLVRFEVVGLGEQKRYPKQRHGPLTVEENARLRNLQLLVSEYKTRSSPSAAWDADLGISAGRRGATRRAGWRLKVAH